MRCLFGSKVVPQCFRSLWLTGFPKQGPRKGYTDLRSFSHRPLSGVAWHTVKRTGLMSISWLMMLTFSHTWEDQILQETYIWPDWQPLLRRLYLALFPTETSSHGRLAVWYLRSLPQWTSAWKHLISVFTQQDKFNNGVSILWQFCIKVISCDGTLDHGLWNKHIPFWLLLENIEGLTLAAAFEQMCCVSRLKIKVCVELRRRGNTVNNLFNTLKHIWLILESSNEEGSFII